MKRFDGMTDLPAVVLRDRLAEGAVKAVDVASAFLKVVNERESDIRAFAWLDSNHVLDQARRLDMQRSAGRPIGPLHGLPVAIKDVIDTSAIPTENGTVIDGGRVPRRDAVVVERLKAAGAILFGKTATSELAFRAPPVARNPHDRLRTPGGSSSGSAAAVAAGMVPVALGTQTIGGIIEPASFCGVTGYKPSFGAIARTGVLMQAPSLDTVGVLARDVQDAALVADALFGHDRSDPATGIMPFPRLAATAAEAPPLPPVFAFYRPPGFERLDGEMAAAFGETTSLLGDACFEIALPMLFEEAAERLRTIHLAELAKCYYPYERRGARQLGPELIEALAAGRTILARDYIAALDWRSLMNAALDEVFERCDALIVPASFGPAPEAPATGDPAFSGIWTMAGAPVVALPLFMSSEDLPMGVQLIGRLGGDGRLLRTARWLADHIAEATRATATVAAPQRLAGRSRQ